jgi:hypothetical protein
VDVDQVPAASSAEGLGAADAAARLGVRRHPVVLAAILSDFVVRAMEIAAAVNSGRGGNLNPAVVRVLARDLGRDLGRAREYVQARQLKLDGSLTRRSAVAFTPGQVSGSRIDLMLIGCFGGAIHLARRLVHAIDGTLGRQRDLCLSFSRDEDLESADVLIAGLESALDRAGALNEALFAAREQILYGSGARVQILGREQIPGIDRSLGRAVSQALARSRDLDRICAQGVAGRLGISVAQGLAQALLDGVLDDFTNADLTHASLPDTDLTGVRWSLSGTIWPPGTDVKALRARSERAAPGGGVLVVTRRARLYGPLAR